MHPPPPSVQIRWRNNKDHNENHSARRRKAAPHVQTAEQVYGNTSVHDISRSREPRLHQSTESAQAHRCIICPFCHLRVENDGNMWCNGWSPHNGPFAGNRSLTTPLLLRFTAKTILAQRAQTSFSELQTSKYEGRYLRAVVGLG